MMAATGLWAVLFGLGGIAVLVLALILMRQKANQAELWKQDPENPGPKGPSPDSAPGPSAAQEEPGRHHQTPEGRSGREVAEPRHPEREDDDGDGLTPKDEGR